jgi:hypothetical protein
VPGLSSTTASLGTTAVGRLQVGENLTGRVYDLAYDDLTVDGGAATPTSTSTSTSTSTVQYECGGLAAFQQSYDKTWGPLKAITHRAVGNHEYIAGSSSPPGTDCDPTATAAGYFTYFGAAAGDPGKGYYSYAVGSWHVIVLNTTCGKAGGCGPGSPQETWLRQDLAVHPAACTLAYFHIPLWSSGGRAEVNATTFTSDLVNAHADVILTGHDHIYERFALQNASGTADPNGVRAFVVGTGGKNHTDVPSRAANSEVVNSTTFGFLRLTLHPNGYDWRFVPEPGKTFSDSGSEACR